MASSSPAVGGWRKSSRSANTNCVEVAFEPSTVGVRHSADPDGPHLTYTREAWRAFIDGVKDGDFGDRPPGRSRKGLAAGDAEHD